MGNICANGFPAWSNVDTMFYKADQTPKPPVASGYYSKKVRGVKYGTLQPLTTLDLYSYACCYQSGITNEAYVKDFCSNLLDAGGNIVTNPPVCCGGTGPDILNYNPISAAIDSAQPQAENLAVQYDATKNVKLILEIGVALFFVIILISVLWAW
jgi:hypothetical protein